MSTVAPAHAGSCLCGGIRYRIDGDLGDYGCCHCRSCRKASGSAFGANVGVDRARFHVLQGAELLKEYESSPGKLRVFCQNCGSPMFAYLRTTPDVIRVRLGSLDTPFDRRPSAHTWVSDKATWETLETSVPQFPTWAPRSVLVQRGSKQPDDA
jgi:hypothetical protein